MNKQPSKQAPWSWIPTLYFAQGLPYVVVMTLAVIFYKRMGLSNTDIALYTGWLYLPWVIKPLWSPLVDLLKSKRWWIITMQSLVAIAFAGIAFSVPTPFYLQLSLAFLWILAFASATHDIAADGFYLLALSGGEQSFFVGIRNTFYRFSMIFGQGVIVMLAGLIEEGILFPELAGNITAAWTLVFGLCGVLFILFLIYHIARLPHPVEDTSPESERKGIASLWKDFFGTFASYFTQKEIGLLLFFLLTYRLGEAQLVKIASPFLLDTPEAGGMMLSTANVGLAYGTIGVAALLLGGIIGGIVVSRDGLKRWIVPMALAINLPDLFYVYLAHPMPDSIWMVYGCVALEQLGYGFGFSAYMLVLIYAAQGKNKTAHYAIGTGLMALGMMIPGMIAGYLQDSMGYMGFFVWVVGCTIPGIFASFLLMKRISPEYGRR